MRSSVRHILLAKRKVDPFLKDVVLFVKGGADGSTDFVDSSQYNHAITRIGTTIVNSSSERLFGANTIYSSANTPGGRLSIIPNPVFDIGTKDFTLEYWYKRPSFVYLNGYFQAFTFDGIDFPLTILDGDGNLTNNCPSFSWGTSSSWYGDSFRATPAPPTLNVWHHVAFCRKNGVIRAFFDGMRASAQIADSNNIGASGTLTLLGSSGTYYGSMSGYLSNFRFTMAGRYETDFDPYNNTFMI